MFSRFDTIPERDRRTDRIRTSIGLTRGIAVLTRDKNFKNLQSVHNFVTLTI